MKKILLSAAAIIVASAVVGPKIVSPMFASAIKESVAAINENPAYEASITSLENGWFSTSAVVNVGIKLPDMAELGQSAMDASFDVLVSGQHGPIITSGGFSLAWLRTQIETQHTTLPKGLNVLGDAPIYTFQALTPLSGPTSYTDSVASMEYVNDASELQVSFSGMQGKGRFSSEMFEGQSQGGNVSLNVADAIIVELSNLSVNVDADVSLSQMMQQGLYNSTGNITIASIDVMNQIEGSQTRIDNLAMNAVTTLDEVEGVGDVKVSTTAAQVQTDAFILSELLMDIELNNLELAFLQAYQTYSSEMLEYAYDIDRASAATTAFFENHLLSQLQKNPEYNISALSGKINNSSFEGKALAKVLGVNALPDTLENPAFWMQHTHIDSQLNMQTAAAEFVAKQVVLSQLAANPNFVGLSEQEQQDIAQQQVAPTLAALVQQGMLLKTSDGYSMSFILENSAANLNGTPIPM